MPRVCSAGRTPSASSFSGRYTCCFDVVPTSQVMIDHCIVRISRCPGPVFSYKLRYIVGFGLVEMAISTNTKPTIYSNLYENTGTGHLDILTIQWSIITCDVGTTSKQHVYICRVCMMGYQTSKTLKLKHTCQHLRNPKRDIWSEWLLPKTACST